MMERIEDRAEAFKEKGREFTGSSSRAATVRERE
jgi:hypothetical protein